MVSRRVVVAGILVALGVAGCGGVQDPEAEEPGGDVAAEAPSAFGVEEIELGEALAQIRGHHTVALELMEAGETDSALVHVHHPIEEILDVVAAELDEHGGSSEELTAALDDAAAVVEGHGTAEELAAAIEEADAVVRENEAALLGPDATDPAYQGSVLGALLATAAHEYEEAVAGGKGVSLVVEYEDAYGFTTFARAQYDEQLAALVEDEAIEEAEEIEEAFAVLDEALPSVEPPATPEDAEDVEVAAKLIGHELEETVGAQSLEESDPAEVAANIEALLADALEAYEDGDAEEAGELAAEAYLENYELIEAEVIEYAPEINEELEPLLGADLRKEMDAGAPVNEIEDMIARAEELLTEALEVLEEAEE